jgi:hypothetical protein
MFFRRKVAGGVIANPHEGFQTGTLRRVKILAGLTDVQLSRLAQLMELQRVAQWTVIVKQGEHGDAMYLILEGELRVRLIASGKETILSTLGPASFSATWPSSIRDRDPLMSWPTWTALC